MEFLELLDQVLELLRSRGRIPYRALSLQFKLNDETMEALKDELLFTYPLVDENHRGLAWMGETTTPLPKRYLEADSESRFQALLPRVMWLLQHERRVTYRTFKYVFGLDDVLLAEIGEELRLRRLTVDEEGKVLVWSSETQFPPTAAMTPSQSGTAETTTVQSAAIPAPPPLFTPAATETNRPTVSLEGTSVGTWAISTSVSIR